MVGVVASSPLFYLHFAQVRDGQTSSLLCSSAVSLPLRRIPQAVDVVAIYPWSKKLPYQKCRSFNIASDRCCYNQLQPTITKRECWVSIPQAVGVVATYLYRSDSSCIYSFNTVNGRHCCFITFVLPSFCSGKRWADLIIALLLYCLAPFVACRKR